MQRRADLIRLERVTAETELSVVGALLCAARPALLVSTLAGDACAVGRHQLGAGPRRWSGGRATRYGAGIVSLCVVLPRSDAWLDEPGPLSGPRLLNRYVRGVLAGLSTPGAPATYPGRDFVCVRERRVACVSLACEADDAFLFQAIVAARSAYPTGEAEPRFPGLPDPPGAGRLDMEETRLADALAEGFATRFALKLQSAPAPPPGPLPELALPAGLRAGDPVATPIGELRAHVALREDGTLAQVRFTGDWIASVRDVAALEAALVGVRPDHARAVAICARWLAAPVHLVVGVPDPALLVAALRGAAA